MKVACIIVLYEPDFDLLIKNILGLSSDVVFFIVDNSAKSNRFPLNFLLDQGVNFSYIPMESNVGLAGAQNIALEAVTSASCYTHVIFFDQDSILSSKSFNNLCSCEIQLIENGIKVGAVGPVCYDPNDKNTYPLTYYRGPFIELRYPALDEELQVSFLISSGMLTRLSVIEEVGFMNEDFFIDYIDIEWSFRAQSKGYVLFGVGGAVMEHLIGDGRVKFFNRTISKHSPMRRYYLLRNVFLVFTIKHIPINYKVREFFLTGARFFVFLLYSDERLLFLKLSLKGVLDAFSGRFGKIRS